MGFIDTDYLGICGTTVWPDTGHTESLDSVMHKLDELVDAEKESTGKPIFILDSMGGL